MSLTNGKAISARCVASSDNLHGGAERVRQLTANGRPYGKHYHNFFREAQFSEDGTTIITHNDDQRLRTFVLPPDLLEDSEEPRQIDSYAEIQAPGNIQTYAVHPQYDLQDPSSTLVLHSSTEQPLALRNALDYTTVHAKYNLISPTTEQYLTVNSLAFTRDGTRFVSGSNNRLSIFDIAQGYSGPIATHKLAPDRRARKLYGAENLSCKGIVTALAINTDGLLAAGTTQREIGLYADQGDGECLAAFSVAPPSSERDVIRGSGVMHVRWSPDGRYLLAAERQSDCIQVYDVRNMIHRVSWLSGRKAETTQKLGIDVVPTAEGYELWGGGTDGGVRMWRHPGAVEGEQKPDLESDLHEGKSNPAAHRS